jgi:hypothetical protein
VGLEFPSVSAWLQRISQIPSFSGLWVSNAARSEVGDRDVVTFSSSAQLTSEARSHRDEAVAGGEG